MLGVRFIMVYEVKDDFIYIFCFFLSLCKFFVKVIVEIIVLVKVLVIVEYFVDIEEDLIKYLKEKILILNFCSMIEEILKREILEIFQGKFFIREILWCFVRFLDRNIKFDRKKMIFDLKVDLKIFYLLDVG